MFSLFLCCTRTRDMKRWFMKKKKQKEEEEKKKEKKARSNSRIHIRLEGINLWKIPPSFKSNGRDRICSYLVSLLCFFSLCFHLCPALARYLSFPSPWQRQTRMHLGYPAAGEKRIHRWDLFFRRLYSRLHIPGTCHVLLANNDHRRWKRGSRVLVTFAIDGFCFRDAERKLLARSSSSRVIATASARFFLWSHIIYDTRSISITCRIFFEKKNV